MQKSIKQLMNLKLVWRILTFVIGLGFATSGYGQAVVSMKTTGGDTLSVGEEISVNVNIANGKGVAGYAVLLAFDAAALRYVSATPGDYLPPGGVWMAPQLSADGSYEITLSVGDETSSGQTVQFAEQEIGVDAVFINLKGLPPEVQAVSGEEPAPEVLAVPGENPLGISILASSVPDVDSDADGTLVALTFEVLTANATPLTLLDVRISDVEGVELDAIVQSDTLILHDAVAPVDVNGDGSVNILDLVFVASQFGAPVTAANEAADVNGDGTINILDLTRIAQNFGK